MNKEELEELHDLLLDVKYALYDLSDLAEGYDSEQKRVEEYLEKIKQQINNK